MVEAPRSTGQEVFTPRLLSRFEPAYFAFVMATGIVALACNTLGVMPLAWALYALDLGAYGLFAILTVTRLRRLLPGLAEPRRAFGFLAIVAATCVVGVEAVTFQAAYMVALVLAALAATLWVFLIYAFFSTLILREHKPGLENDVSGGWLLAVVSTQGVSILTELVVPVLGPAAEPVRFFALCLFLLGGLMYFAIVSLIMQRLVLFPLAPEAVEPLDWIDMGGSAITTLAGANLVAHAPAGSLQQVLVILLEGGSLVFWVAATWWIPLLVILWIWRHFGARHPFTIDRGYWGLVFPLGMYTVATAQLAHVTGISALGALPPVMGVVALLAWAGGIVGLLRRARSRKIDA